MAESVGGAFCHHLAAANEATKYMQIKIRRGLRWPQNDVKNTTTNQKQAAATEGTTEGRRDEREARGKQGTIVLMAL